MTLRCHFLPLVYSSLQRERKKKEEGCVIKTAVTYIYCWCCEPHRGGKSEEDGQRRERKERERGGGGETVCEL